MIDALAIPMLFCLIVIATMLVRIAEHMGICTQLMGC